MNQLKKGDLVIPIVGVGTISSFKYTDARNSVCEIHEVKDSRTFKFALLFNGEIIKQDEAAVYFSNDELRPATPMELLCLE